MYDGMDGSQEVPGGLLEAFPTLGLQKKPYRKIYRRTQEIYKRKTGKLQDAYRRRPRAVFTILRV